MTRALDPAAVELAGTNLVEASAGTGKTTAITSLYLRLVVEHGLTPERILVVTYTRAATAELRDRIRAKIRATLDELEGGPAAAAPTIERLRDALTRFDRAAIHTIHGFCQRMLDEQAFESGGPFAAEVIESDRELLDEIATDFWTNEVAGPEASATFTAWALDGHVLKKGGVDPTARMAELLRRATAPVEPELRPADPAGSPDWRALEKEWRTAIDAAAQAWRDDRERVIEILRTSDALNRAAYKPDSIESKWIPALDRGFAVRAPILLDEFDKLEHLTPGGMKTKKGKTAPAHPFFDACARLFAVESRIQAVRGDQAIAFWHRLVAYGRAELRDRKRRDRVRSYDDLLVELRDGLAGPRGAALAARIRAAFPAALIDEFQDTDPVQTEIFRAIYDGTGGPLFLVGDPKQAIYSFRGADLHAYLEVARSVTERAFSLDTNHRSDPAYVAALNFLYGQAADPFAIEGIAYHAVTAAKTDRLAGPARFTVPFEVLFVDAPGDEDEGPTGKSGQRARIEDLTATRIVELLDSGLTIGGRPVEPGDVAVLVRKNKQATAMQAALRGRGVPVVLRSHESVLATDVAEDLLRVLRAVTTPERATWVRAALATDLLGEDAEALAALQSDEARWEAWVERFQRWRDEWSERGFMTAFRRLLDDQRIRARLLGQPGGERSLTDLLHLGELIHQAEAEGRLGALGTLRWLTRAHAEARDGGGASSEEAQLRLESDERAVQIVTIHAAKGLEYPIVHCPYLWESSDLHPTDKEWPRYHERDDRARVILDLRGGTRKSNPEVNEIVRRESAAEELRLMYVALTRARHRCSVVWGPLEGSSESPLARLLGGATTLEAAERLAAKSNGTVSIVADAVAGVATAREPSPSRAVAEPAALASRSPSRTIPTAWRISSYSGLIARSEPKDELDALSRSADESGAPRARVTSTPSSSPSEPLPLAPLPGGARTGEMLHALFEALDFPTAHGDALRRITRDTLAAFGFRDAELVEPVATAVELALGTPLIGGPSQLSLATVGKRDRLAELEFVFPIGATGDPSSARLTGEHLAAVFAARADAPWSAAYPESVRRLGFPALAGFLRGFVDLAFTAGGRWYVLDYKSDFLGPAAGDYAPERLARFMEEHHYLLQYHVYTVALHRHLSLRLPGYDYDRDFGGVLYLFLRGLTPSGAGRAGVFHDRPPRASIEALSARFAAPGSST